MLTFTGCQSILQTIGIADRVTVDGTGSGTADYEPTELPEIADLEAAMQWTRIS